MKQVAITDFLNKVEIAEARRLKKAKEINDKIIAPNLARINEALGQENDSMYLAYCVEYVLQLSNSDQKLYTQGE